MVEPKRSKWPLFLLLLGLAVIAGLAAWYLAVCMDFAPWGFSDSATYFSSAHNLAGGIGLGTVNAEGTFTPLQIFAPLFPVLLSPFAKLGADLIITSKILDILLFVLLLIGCGWLFYLLSDSALAAFFFALLIATTPALATDYSSMMSEPLAITLGMPAFLLLLLAIKQNSLKLLLLAAVLAGLAFAARYAFVAVPISGILALLFLSQGSGLDKFKRVLLYAAISILPMLVWMSTAASVGSRHYSLAFSLKEKISTFVTQLASVLKYWLPYRTDMIPHVKAFLFDPILLLFLLALVALGLLFSLGQKTKTPGQRSQVNLLLGSLILLVVYIGFLLLTYLISAETISLDDRMLSPIVPLLYAALLISALIVGQKIPGRVSSLILGVLINLFFVVFNYLPLQTYLINVSTYPDGYASPAWKNRPIFGQAALIPHDRPILSNGPDLLLFYTNRSAFYLTRATGDLGSTTVSVTDPEQLKKLIEEDCGVLVLFDTGVDSYEHRLDPISQLDINALAGRLTPSYSGTEGQILIDPKCSNP